MRVQDSPHERLAQLGTALDLKIHGTKTPLEDCDLNYAIAELLLREIRHSKEITSIAVITLHPAGSVIEAVEVKRLANELAHRFSKLFGREDGVAAEAEFLHRDPQLAADRQRRPGWRDLRQHRLIARRDRQSFARLLLLQDGTGVGRLLRGGDKAQ